MPYKPANTEQFDGDMPQRLWQNAILLWAEKNDDCSVCETYRTATGLVTITFEPFY